MGEARARGACGVAAAGARLPRRSASVVPRPSRQGRGDGGALRGARAGRRDEGMRRRLFKNLRHGPRMELLPCHGLRAARGARRRRGLQGRYARLRAGQNSDALLAAGAFRQGLVARARARLAHVSRPVPGLLERGAARAVRDTGPLARERRAGIFLGLRPRSDLQHLGEQRLAERGAGARRLRRADVPQRRGALLRLRHRRAVAGIRRTRRRGAPRR